MFFYLFQEIRGKKYTRMVIIYSRNTVEDFEMIVHTLLVEHTCVIVSANVTFTDGCGTFEPTFPYTVLSVIFVDPFYYASGH